MTLTSTSPDLGVGVGTVSTSIVQSATEFPFPAEVTTSRFISLGISEAVMVGFCFLGASVRMRLGTWHGLLTCRCVGGGAKFEIRIYLQATDTQFWIFVSDLRLHRYLQCMVQKVSKPLNINAQQEVFGRQSTKVA